MPTPSVLVVGDGPTGLSAALFLAKNKVAVEVVGYGETPVHKALLKNFLGTLSEEGPEFLKRARKQAESFGAKFTKGWIEKVEVGERILAHTNEGARHEADFLVVATGFDKDLVEVLGFEKNEDGGARADRNGRTSIDRVYAGGSVVRGTKTQVATSVGDGAAIAIDILSRIRGRPFHDFDTIGVKKA
ncbi:MAG: FAD-dependent oxidoreductase [Methanobacteriota archaeon]